MSRTNKVRYGGAALTGAIAIGCLMNQTAALAGPTAPDQPRPTRSSVLQPISLSPAPAVATSLSILKLPSLEAAAAATGYAGQDITVDVSADLSDRDETFHLQRQDGADWVNAATGTTAGPQDIGTVTALPAGTYRVVVPTHYGMPEFVGQAFAHSPRQLTASLASDAGVLRLTADAGVTATWQRQVGSQWKDVDSAGTSISNPAAGTYRVVVPNQVDALGTVTNTVTVKAKTVATTTTAPKSAGVAAATTDSASTESGDGIVGTATAQLGDRYVTGGNGPSAFDCSGLTSYVYRLNGVSIPRTAAAQYRAATKVSDPRAGDLVFFLNNGAEHVGVYLGNGRMVHAANPSSGVIISNIGAGWYAKSFTGYGRY